MPLKCAISKRRLLRVPWTARTSYQSTLREISPEYSLEGLMLELSSNTLATWYPDAEKDWRQEEKEMAEVGWHNWFNGLEFEQTPGDSEGQGSLKCCSPWSPKAVNTTEWLNNKRSLVGRKITFQRYQFLIPGTCKCYLLRTKDLCRYH